MVQGYDYRSFLCAVLSCAVLCWRRGIISWVDRMDRGWVSVWRNSGWSDLERDRHLLDSPTRFTCYIQLIHSSPFTNPAHVPSRSIIPSHLDANTSIIQEWSVLLQSSVTLINTSTCAGIKNLDFTVCMQIDPLILHHKSPNLPPIPPPRCFIPPSDFRKIHPREG